MMVNGVALSSMIAGGWGGGAVPNATGTAEFAIDVSAVDAQAATGGVRINFIPRDGGNRFSGTIFGSFATESFASDNFTGTDVQAARPGRARHDQGRTATSIPGFGGPIKRDKLWFFLSGRKLFADNYVAGMFFNQNANNLDRYDYVPSTHAGHPAPGAVDLPGALHLAGQPRRTRSASPSTRRTSARARPASDRSRRRTCRPRPATIAASRCSASSPSTGTRRSATGCWSKRAASTASSAGAAWSRRSASWATSTT